MLKKSPLDTGTVRDFRRGYCHLLAQSFFRHYEWPIWGLRAEETDNFWHFFNETPDCYIDAKGLYRTENEVIYSYSSSKDQAFIAERPDPSDFRFEEPLFDDVRGEANEIAGKLYAWYQQIKFENNYEYLVEDI